MITLKARLRATPNGLLAAALLSFLATAGLFYVNIMPAIIEGLSRGLGLTTREAGLIGSANIYGAAFGAFASVFLVRHLPWRAVTAALLVALMLVDLTSIVLESVGVLVGVRAVHGIVGGLLVGFAFSVIARTARPERTFGMLLIVQFGLGGLGVMFLPRLAAAHGTWVLFVALFAFSAVTLMMTPWLDDYAVERSAATQNVRLRGKHSSLFVLALLAVFLFQAANMALFSYILGLAGYFGLDLDFASRAVGAATWIGIAGSMLVIGLSTRRGRVVPLVTALVVTVIGFWLLHYSASKAMYVIANCGTGITWAFVMPYLLGMCAEFDEGGQAAAFGGFASKMGLASGPMLGALLLQEENYSLLISISSIGILLCMVAAFIPARMLDMRRNPSRPPRDGIYP
ncbi:MAG TPA: MFS transporter [Steroidobacter sp.]|uniref:MFS transporter n=1 Tax=Steroidobacter sp. TaxID=1978227 RepID=UPI002EDACF90